MKNITSIVLLSCVFTLSAQSYDVFEKNPATDFQPNGYHVPIAVIDTGIDIRHSALQKNIYVNASEIPDNGIDDDQNGFIDDVIGWDFGQNDNNPNDFLIPKKNRPPLWQSLRDFNIGEVVSSIKDLLRPGSNGHGTHVSGIVLRENPDARILPIRIDFKKGHAYKQILQAVKYAVAMKAPIVNMSLGGPMADPITKPLQFKLQKEIIKTMRQASDTLFVIAAGNNGRNLDQENIFPGGVDLPNIITVGAVDKKDKLAAFSNYSENIVEIFAYGVKVDSTWPGDSNKKSSGTSMAAPHVTGIASHFLYQQPQANIEQLKTYLSQISFSSTISHKIERAHDGEKNKSMTISIIPYRP